ncbi:DoxX family protein [Corynebacterium sp. CNCTC7651]|uniref:DoxX family protein n=1 Tax=Corynebacterium sp. CNCTC7651 TaxID=2815361 RepID=UPI001F2F38E2|nr:DoxX family protein [Corynebacterium sp. CNCTC7651]UIZ93005.1 DoxX family protein [Corynebacterium sp. CNCTC7651]
MARNTRDARPDDFDAFDVPTYQPPTGAQSGAGVNEPTEVLSTGGSTAVNFEDRVDTSSFAATPAATSETVALDREPMYIPPAEPEYIAPAEPTYEEVAVVSEPAADTAAAKRGTIDLGLLLLRLAFGGYLILAALTTFFRFGGSDGIAGLETAFAAYPYANGLAIMVPTLQLAAGVFLVLGLLTPVAAAVAVAVTAFMALHAIVASGIGWNVLTWNPGIWLPVLLFAIAVVLQFTGPGLYGVDGGRSWARRPLASSWIWLVVGLAIAGVVWWFGTGINPVAPLV